MCDLWYVIQPMIDDPQLINALLVIPSTWIVLEDKEFFKYPKPPLSPETITHLAKMIQERQNFDKQWPKYQFHAKKSTYSFNEAVEYLKILSDGRNNANNDERIENLLDVSSLRPGATESTNQQIIIQPEQQSISLPTAQEVKGIRII